jgi:hypothetical protein
MEDKNKIYFSLDEARAELALRRQDMQLIKKVETDLGDQKWPIFKDKPMGVLTKYLPSPDNSLTFFIQMAHYVGVVPIVLEFLGDKFVLLNEEKKGLGRLRVFSPVGDKFTVDLVDFKANENKKISEVVTKAGEPIVDFHHRLLKEFGSDVELEDSTEWLRKPGKKIDYYRYLLNFVVHGVLFEYYTEEDENEKTFTREVFFPSLEKIYQNYGLRPLIVKLYPENQNEEEDFYWWSYPLNINNYILDYAKKNQLPLKNISAIRLENNKARKIDENISAIEDPEVMFSRVMAISDKLILDYFKFYVGIPSPEIKRESGTKPQDLKLKLAHEIVRKYFGEAGAEKTKQNFLKAMEERGIPDKLFEITFENNIKLASLLIETGLVADEINWNQKIKQGSVWINGKKEENRKRVLIQEDDNAIIKIGRVSFIRIRLYPLS